MSDFKYWAFISYSHQDKHWGDWLHKTLETYRVPVRLVGRASRDGAVPRRLFPVFRDREELPSSAALGDNIGEALRGSRYLVVICSPYSAVSRWVDEEIKSFKRLGREDRILALIVAGEPNASDKPESGLPECFPAALRHRLGADGELTPERVEPIAADARAGKDGRTNAKLKLLSGLLGVGYDELRQRERQRRLRHRLRWGTAAVLLLSLAAGLWHWKSGRDLAAVDLEQGRQALLAGDPFTAALYLNAAYTLGDRTPATRLMLARALAPITAPVHTWHTDRPVLDAQLSADGRGLLTADAGGVTRWEAATGKRVSDIRFAPDAPPLRVRLSRTGRYAAVLDGSETVTLYDTRNGHHTRLRASSRVESVSFDAVDGHLLATGGGKSVDVFDIASARRHTFTLANELGLEAQLSDDGTRLLTQNDDALRVWDTTRGTPLATVKGYFSAAYLEPDGKSVRTRRSGHIEFWDAVSGRLIRDQPGPAYTLLIDAPAMQFFALDDGRRYLISDRENKVSLFDSADGGAVHPFPLLTDKPLFDLHEFGDGRLELLLQESPGVLAVRDPDTELPMGELALPFAKPAQVAFDRAGDRVLAYTDDAVLVWDVPLMPAGFGVQDYHWQEATAHQWSPDSRRLLYTAPGGALSLYDFAASRTAWESADCPDVYAAPVFDHRGTHVAAGCGDGTWMLLDAADGRRVSSLVRSSSKPLAISFSPDDEWLAIVGDSTTVRDLKRGNGFTVPRPNGGFDWLAAFTPDSNELAVFGRQQRIVKLDSRQVIATSALSKTGAETVSVSPDGGVITIVDPAGLTRIDVTGSKVLPGLVLQTHHLHEAAMSRDGRRLLLIDDDGARVLDASNGALIASLEQRTGTATFHERSRIADVDEWDPVTDFGADDDFVLVAAGSMLGIWDAHDGRLLSILGRFPDLIHSASFAPDGTHAAASDSVDLRVWDTSLESSPPAEVVAWLACRVPWRLEGDRRVATRPDFDTCPTK